MAAPVSVGVVALDPVLEAGTLSTLRLCPQVTTATEADSAALHADQAEVVVLTVDRFGPPELELLRAARDTAARPAIVLVAGELAAADALHALAAGARGLLRRREADTARLADAVLAAARGDCTLPPDLFDQVLGCSAESGHQTRSVRQGTVTGLSERERAVLEMVAEGHETSEIATRLAYSQRTVTTVLHDITQRFRLRNRAHAVAYALRTGML